MENWEFLIQKEGDRSWLPLDSPDVEILEGRYRIVARSIRANTPVEVRIGHLMTELDPPRRRLQKRSSRTNQNGLMVLIPFTRLEPGIWSLQCSSSDLMADLVGDAWKHTVHLHVLPCEVEAEAWEPDWVPAQAEAVAQGVAGVEKSVSDARRDAPDATGKPAVIPASAVVAAEPDSDALRGLPEVTAQSEPAPAPDQASEQVVEQAATEVVAPAQVEPIVLVSHSPVVRTAGIDQLLDPSLDPSMDRWLQLTEQLSDQLMDEVLGDFDQDLAAAATAPMKSQTVDSGTSTATNSPAIEPAQAQTNLTPPEHVLPDQAAFSLQLDQEALVASQGEELTLSGQVEVVTQAADAVVQELQLYLRDPQSLQVLVSDRQFLPGQTGAVPFCFRFTVPDPITTCLLLGELVLCGTVSAQDTRLPIVLTTQTFTITVNPKDLVQQLTKLNQVLAEDLDDPVDSPLDLVDKLEERAAKPSLELSFLNLVPAEAPSVEVKKQPATVGSIDLTFLNLVAKDSGAEKVGRFASATKLVSSPLDHPAPTQTKNFELKLPSFATVGAAGDSPADAATEPSEPAAAIELNIVADALIEPNEAVSAEQNATGVSQTDDSSGVTVIAPAEPADREPSLIRQSQPESKQPADDPAGESSVSNQPPSFPAQHAFQALKIQDRFLTRLSALAGDTELAALLRGNSPNSTQQKPAVGNAVPPLVEDSSRWGQEVVVDDEPVQPRSRRRSLKSSDQDLDSTRDLSNPLLLPEDEPVPVPELKVTTGELVAGKPVHLRVRLPDLLPRIYVKLWVNDRQTRSLLDGPRWLVDFLPNGHGELEANTQLTVPFGSLEIRFEAIAIEMHTQRESHKVTVDRAVIPPDLPVLSLEEFEA